MTTVYGLSHCSTCQKACAWLAEHGIAHTFVDYRQTPVPTAILDRQAEAIGWEKLVNRASYTWRGLDELCKSPATGAEWLALVREYPALIRRPLLVADDGQMLSGFSAARYAQALLT